MSAPRSLADDLRARSDEALRELLSSRADLLAPVPSDISALAARAGSTPSVLRALDGLDLWSLQVLETICALGDDVPVRDVVAATDGAADHCISRLRTMALIFGNEILRVPAAVREAVGSEPAGLGPVTHMDPTAALQLLEDAPLAATSALEKLVWGPPRGLVNDIRQAPEGIAWLLQHKLLLPLDRTTVALPRELGLALRGGRVLQNLAPSPPALEGERLTRIDDIGAHSAATFLRWAEELLEAWSIAPAETIRAGGIGVRELKRAANLLDVEEGCAAFVIETLFAAGLLGPSVEQPEVFLPSTSFDLWLTHDGSQRWATLVSGWLNSSRVAGMVARDERSKNVSALGPEVDRTFAAALRRQVISLLADEEGLAPTAQSLTARLAWFAPRRAPSLREQMVEWTLTEAQWLGVTARGALTSYARALLEDGTSQSLEAHLPRPVDHILIQADLTAIAPGPLEPDFAREMMAMADIESKGGATVYRFTESSLRRALDNGFGADQITALLNGRSKTPLPQPLVYLISDVARRHGHLRVGTAGSYLRCDDEALIAKLMSDKNVSSLRLRRLASSVLISLEDPEDLLRVLTDAGYAPAAESSDGTLLIRKQQSRRSPRKPHESGPALPQVTELLLDSALRAIRGGDRAVVASKARMPATALPKSSEMIVFLQEAVQSQASLWVGFADVDGGVTQRIVDPMSISRGVLTGFDHTAGEVRRFPIYRITAVATVEKDA
jgi:hypothetical protein